LIAFEKSGLRWRVLFVGWKDIASACGGLCEDTMMVLAKKYDMPITRLNGRPSITDDELRLWWERLRFRQGKGPTVVRRYKKEMNES
jgi:hypothetical protein